jgi:NitT/TauT family transport system permease protein
MKDLLQAFRPNIGVPQKVMFTITLGWTVLILVAWQLLAVKPIPVPSDLPGAFIALVNSTEIVRDLIASVTLNIEATALATMISCGLAYLTVMAGTQPVVAVVSKLRYLGLTGITFLFSLYCDGHALKVVLLTFGMTVFLTTSMESMVRSIKPQRYQYARTLGLSEWRAVWEVAVRGTLDQTLDIVRQNSAISWMMLTTVEGFVRFEGGLGVLLLNGNKQFRLETVFVLQVIILVLGLSQDYLLGVLRNVLCPWATKRK